MPVLHLFLPLRNVGLFFFHLLWSHSYFQLHPKSLFPTTPLLTVYAVLPVLDNFQLSQLVYFSFLKSHITGWPVYHQQQLMANSLASHYQLLPKGETLFTLPFLTSTVNFILQPCAKSQL